MKILFGSDISVNYLQNEIDDEIASSLVREIKPLFDEADFSVVNLENILYDCNEGAIVKSGPCLRAPRKSVALLKALNVDVAGLANNHFGDYGVSGINSTLDCLKKNKIDFVGGGNDIEQAYRSKIFEKDGIRVSVIAVCENEFGIADEAAPGAAGYNLSRLAARLKEEKSHANYTVVYFHGGNERNPYPSPGKVELYRFFTKIGADAVIAMHTHCPQGYEIYKGKPVVYSMGNFYFPASVQSGLCDNPNNSWYYGYLTGLEFTASGIKLNIYPFHFTNTHGAAIELLKGVRLQRFLDYIKKLNEPLSDKTELKRLFNIWCTMAGISYSSHVSFKPEMIEGNPEHSRNLKNIFSCEAHNELIHNLMELCFNNKFEEHAACQSEIIKLQTINL